jgi:hypothetical protein
MVPGSISIWEVGFSSMNTLAEVKSFLLPNEPSLKNLLFLPTLSKLAFTLKGKVLIWDAKKSKPLLDFVVRDSCKKMSFSSDGHFFAYATKEEVHLWKESPIGYTLHQNLTFRSVLADMGLLFSPNGESIIMFNDCSVSLWLTGDPIISPSSTQYNEQDGFLLEISTAEMLATVELEEGKVVILDLNSGDPQLVIDVGMQVRCLRATGSMVVVANSEKVVAWDIPAGGSALNARMNIDDSVHITMFDHSPWTPSPFIHSISVSPDLNYFAIILKTTKSAGCLSIYNTWTGERLASTTVELKSGLHFTPDGCEIWSIPWSGPVARWSITQSESHLINLKCLEPIMRPLGVARPKESSCGYRVTDDGWILSPTQKRLLWLPHHWQSLYSNGVWKGQFLMFLLDGLSEFVLFECLE